MDYLTDTARRDLFPVGRLDIDTEGLLLVTNDGALAHALLSPARHVSKTYYAKVSGNVSQADVNLFEKGVDIGEKTPTRPSVLEILREGEESEILLTIYEGKFHQVKRMFAAFGIMVTGLHREKIGGLSLDPSLPEGGCRPLSVEEIAQIETECQAEIF